ncbi:MAG: WecB/TagA/CpsF family glycosyltransferase [Bacillaceae bacterium]
MIENILGVSVSLLHDEDLIQQLFQRIQEKQKAFVVAINPEKIMKARKDEELKTLLNKATYPIPDGIGVILASKLKRGQIKQRITGIDMMVKICAYAEMVGKRVFLYGGRPGIAQIAAEKLVQQFPNLQIAGTHHGFEQNNQILIRKINDSNADIVFVALGSPRQEKWIVANMDQLNSYVFQGVGGSYDVLAGTINRAPLLFQQVGLEWLYRLAKEPWRVKRQLSLVSFLFLALLDKRMV